MNARTDRFPLFDSLRALAALSIVGFHAALFADVSSPIRAYAAHWDVGVTVFFLISGFLLYRPFVRARLEGESGPRAAAYGWRRFLRVVPAYWVALTVVALWLGLGEVFTLSGIPTFYGFAQIYSAGTATQGIDQAWTLCVEVSFYVFLPLWALLMRLPDRRGSRPAAQIMWMELAALGLLALMSVAYKVWMVRHVDATSLGAAPWAMSLPNFLDDFALGMALAVLSAHYERMPSLPRLLALPARYPALPWAGALVAFWAVSTQIGFTGEPSVDQDATRTMFLERHALYAAVALGILFPAVFGDQARGLVRRLLAARVLRYVGLISYGVYLYHLAVLTAFNRRWGGGFVDLLPAGSGWRFAGFLALGAAGAAALATISYYVVERPALSLKRLVRPRLDQARAEAIAEPAPAVPAAAPRGG